MELRIRVGGVLDGSRAMELLTLPNRCGTGEVVLDFSGIREFEPFEVEVLVRGWARCTRGAPGSAVLGSLHASRSA